MNKIKKSLTLLSAIALMGGIVGCGGNKSSDSIEVVFWHSFGKTVQDTLAKKIASFEAAIKENEGVDVKITQVYKGGYTDINNLVKKSFSTATTPTITVAYPDHVADYIEAESTKGQYVVRLDDYMNNASYGFGKQTYLGDEEGIDDFIPSYIQEGQNYVYEGTYSLPFMKSTEVMYYNVEMVSKALKMYNPERFTGESEIKAYLENISWDELMTFAQFVNENKASISNSLEGAPVFYDSDGNAIITYMYQNNIGYSSLSAEGHGVIDYASGENRTKLQNLLLNFKKQYDSDLFCTKGTVGTYGSTNFTQMKTMFSIGSTGGAGYNFPTADAFTIGCVKVPTMNNNPKYVSQGVTLALLKGPQYSDEENTKRAEYGWKFMKYLTNSELNTQINIQGSEGYVPVRQSCYETDIFIQEMEDETNDYAKVWDVIVNDINGKYYNSAVFPGSTVLRTSTGSLFTDVLMKINCEDKTDTQVLAEIDEFIQTAVDNANLSIK